MSNLRNLLENKGFHRIPLIKLNTGHYKLRIKINKQKGDFILDTGASTSCIGFKSIAYFHLSSEESEIKAAGAGAVGMMTKISKKNSFSVGSWHLKEMDFVLFDLSHVNEALQQTNEKEVHGILGADFLKRTRSVIDYGRNCLYIT
ncbi:MAG: putative aspartyl protease [Flavobacteriaceae bacterium]|jgi:predicted aspartyl protease|uniref:retropepsin-like aspartic protease n=1 Tax=Candidatus Marifrigoribacter sp. Uisw_064 TaxID=3230970 RepID=UPI003AD8AE58